MFEKSADSVFSVKVLKQKQNIDGISFILQEIYGMESKGSSDKSVGTYNLTAVVRRKLRGGDLGSLSSS